MENTNIDSKNNVEDNLKTEPISFWQRLIYLINHSEVKDTLKLVRGIVKHERQWSYLIESAITIIVAGALILLLISLVDKQYIDKGSFGVMFGTVFGYLLSWRFGK